MAMAITILMVSIPLFLILIEDLEPTPLGNVNQSN